MATAVGSATVSHPSKTTFQLLEEQNKDSSCLTVAIDYLAKTPCLEYGYQYNTAEAVGTYLLTGFSTAVEWLRKPETDVKHVHIAWYKVLAVALLILSAPFTIIGGIIKLCGSVAQHTYQELLDVDVKQTDPETVDQIYEIFRIFSEVAEEEGLDEWFIYSGTALGEHIRDGMIPWDDDGDMALLKEALPKLLNPQMIERLKERGVIFEDSLGVRVLDHFSDERLYTLRLDPKKEKEILGYKPSTPATVDIFILSETTKEVDGEEQEVYFFDHYSCQKKFPREFVLKSELETPEGHLKTERRSFGPPRPDGEREGERHLMVNCLSREASESYLKRTYGQSCLERGRTSHFHPRIFGIALPPIFPMIPVECINTPGYYAEGKKWTREAVPTFPSTKAQLAKQSL